MDAAQQTTQPDAAAARARVERQFASLRTSLGWLVQILEPHAAAIATPEQSFAFRLRRAARMLSWTSREQERLVFFAERLLGLEAETEQALAAADAGGEALTALAVRLEQASAEALAFYMAMQSEAAQAATLSMASEADEDSPPRLRARADIGAAVRARLAAAGAQKLAAIGLELYRIRGFIEPADCEAVIELIERDLFPSGILGDKANEGFRTSHSCNLSPLDPPVERFDSKVPELIGINRRFSEVVQGQRYEVGEEFKAHHDFFHRGESYYDDVAKQGGQRTWTAMAFLNATEAGGCTNFPLAGLMVAPEPGTLLLWNNMQADGRANKHSLHQGMPVEAGRKYVLTKWFRERPLVY